MSVKNIESQITKFLQSTSAEVLCIRGNWGTGKTYNWQSILQKLSSQDKVRMKKYSYVSLFGVNSLDEFKQEIIHQKISVKNIGEPFNYEDIQSYINNVYPGFMKASRWAAKFFEKNYTNTGVAIAYMFVRNQLICVDDLERKGKDLRSSDVLGLISQLSEERNCKVVILLNDEQLKDDDKDDFERYLEKVVDINLRFNPTAAESAEIALKALSGTDRVKMLVSELTTSLGIDNVRVIRKIYSFVQLIEPLLSGYKSDVFDSVVKTIVLMGWCHLQPEIAPSKEFLIHYKGHYGAASDGEAFAQEKNWSNLLSDYGYAYTDEFDLDLMRGIEDGYFSNEIIESHAVELDCRVRRTDAAFELSNAWRNFHNSFELDLDTHLENLKRCLTINAEHFTLSDVIPVVNLFREFNREKDGDAVLNAFLEARSEDEDAYSFGDLEMFGHRIDDDIKEKISALSKIQKQEVPVEKLFLILAEQGYRKEVLVSLAALPVSEYVRILKYHKGEDFEVMRRALTQYNNLVNPSENHIEIMRKTSEALQQIAKDSPVNEFRVKRWGITEHLAKFRSSASAAEVAGDE
jgi:hypothetical protein